MQFQVVRLAKDLPAQPPLPRPPFHPPHFATFEQDICGSRRFPDINVLPQEIVRLSPAVGGSRKGRGFSWNCSLCSFPRGFERLTTYWAHLRVDHSGTSQAEVLQAVTRSARANQAWADSCFYDYSRSNPTTWQKIVQAQAADFSWEVFENWRLPKVNLYAGRHVT